MKEFQYIDKLGGGGEGGAPAVTHTYTHAINI